ncbi:MAG: hypothetical protein ACSLFF_09355 [Solirubrobacterales bacterium]
MQIDGFRRFLPYTGVICAITLIAGLVLSGTTPEEGASTAQFLDYYGDNQTAGFIANFIFANLFAIFTLFFVTELRATLRSGEAGESIYSSLAFSGGIVLAVAISLGGMVSVAAFSAGDAGFEAATVALGMLAAYSFIPWMVGGAALFLAAGIGGLKTATLPKWISWLSVVMGVLCFTPGGFAAFIVQPIWFVAMAVVLIRRQSASTAQKPVATATPAVA